MESGLTAEEIEAYHKAIGANFGSVTPVQVVQQGLLKAACGWHNGSTCDSILQHHGLITRRHSDNAKLTRKGQLYLWDTFGKVLRVAI